jgi:hypothetical protein
LDDGRVAMVGQDGSSRFATTPDGQTLRTSLPKQATLSPADRQKAITDLALGMAGNSPLTEEHLAKATQSVDGGGAEPTAPEGTTFAGRSKDGKPIFRDSSGKLVYDDGT